MNLLKPLILAILFVLASCAPILDLKKLPCGLKIQKLIEQDKQIKDDFSFRAVIFYQNKKLFVKGEAKGKDYLKLKVYLPFGIKLGTIEKTDEKTCVEIKGVKECFGKINLLKELFDIDIPLQSVISRKFYLSGKEKYSCKGNRVFVDTKNFTIIYKIEMNKFVPEKIIFSDYEIIYKKENDKDVIYIDIEGVQIKIQIEGIYT